MQESHTFLAKFIHWTFIPLYAYGIFKQVDDIEALEDQALLIFETIFALKVFDLIYVLTSGGPGKSTSVLGWSIYINTFKKLDFGSGSALAMILGLITLFLAIMFYSFLDRGEKQ